MSIVMQDRSMALKYDHITPVCTSGANTTVIYRIARSNIGQNKLNKKVAFEVQNCCSIMF